MSLASALEGAADAFPEFADGIRPANGDPVRLLGNLDRASSIEILGWLLKEDPNAGEELIETWMDEADGLAVITELSPTGLSKMARKVIRKAQHSLRSRGISLPKTEPEAKVATLPNLEESFNTAAVTPIDPEGTRLLFVVEENPSGGLRLFEVTVSEERGVLGVRVYSAGRSKIRNFLRSLKTGAVAEVGLVKALIARAMKRHPEDRPLPASLSEWRGHLIDAESQDAPTPAETVAQAIGDPGELDSDFVIDLAKRGEVGPWPPDMKRLEAVAQRIKDKLDGPIVLNEKQRLDQIRIILDECLEEFFAGAKGTEMANRYKEAAYIHWRQGNEKVAKACLAASQAFLETPPASNVIARYLVEMPLSSVLPQGDVESKDEEESLIVSP